MTVKQFLSEVNDQPIDRTIVIAIQQKYDFILPVQIQHIVSASEESIFFDDDCRTLSVAEILDANEDLHADFKKLKLLPLFDVGDNDFLVYHADRGSWSKFNIIDECHFKSKMTLEEYF